MGKNESELKSRNNKLNNLSERLQKIETNLSPAVNYQPGLAINPPISHPMRVMPKYTYGPVGPLLQYGGDRNYIKKSRKLRKSKNRIGRFRSKNKKKILI